MKKLVLFFITLFLAISTSGCSSDKAAILFNNNKITAENALNYSQIFQPNQRIYYLILIPKKIKTKSIVIHVIKKESKDELLGYKLYWTYSARLKDDQMYYYDDYVVIPETGAYLMQVFSKDNPTKILCTGYFFVR